MPNRRNAVYALLILSLITGLFTGRSFFFNLAYLLSGLLIVSFVWSWASVRWISVSRRTRARRAQVGRMLNEVFVIHNRAFLPKLWLEVRDHSDLPGHRASHVVPALSARSRYRWYIETLCLVRGEFHLGPLTILSGDPFGFYVASRRLNATSRVIVYPATVPVSRFELPVGLLSGGDAQRRRTHFITTNAAGVRDYVPGDSFNRIHWRTTARRNQLTVKEFELDPLVDIWLFVDFSAASLVEMPSVVRSLTTGNIIPNDQGIPHSTEEYVVVVAASLAQHFIELERALGFTAYVPHREVYQPERGTRQLSRILQTLAVARSFSRLSLHQMLTLEAPHFSRGTTLVIITASANHTWLTEAQTLARRGIRPMCVLVDPASFGGPPSNEIQGMLRLARIPLVVVKRGDDIAAALGQRPI